MPLNDRIEAALDAFWHAAYEQGRDQRDHDDEDGTAQKAEEELRNSIRQALAAARTPPPQTHLRGDPVAWRVTRYDNKGAWLDTTLHIRKPEIASTSRTDIEPLYLGQEASTHD